MLHEAARPPLNVELRHLRYFVAVAEELHFGRAAARVFIAQPALSNAIRGLERELGVRLFDRTTRSVALTAAGEDLLASARVVLGAVSEALARAQEVGGCAHPPLVLGVSPDVERLVGPAVDAFLSGHPGTHVELVVCSDAAAIEHVRSGILDGALCWTAGFVGASLQRTSLADHAMVAALPAAHPLAALELVPVRRFAEEAAVLFPREFAPGLWDSLTEQLYGTGKPPNADAHDRNRSYEEMVRCACERGRVTVVPAAFMARQGHGPCVFRPFEVPVLARVELVTRVDAPVVLRSFAVTALATLDKSSLEAAASAA